MKNGEFCNFLDFFYFGKIYQICKICNFMKSGDFCENV